MKLAFTTLACPGWTIEQAAEAGARYGYAGIELRLLDGEVIGPGLSAAERERIARVCEATGLAICCLDTSVRVAQPDPSAREAQVRDGLVMLEHAAALGAPVIRVFAGAPEGTDEAAAVAAAGDGLARLAERGEQLGVVVALETHDVFCSSAAVAAALQQAPRAQALWDLLHPYRIGEPTDVTLGRLIGRLAHVHIKDGRPPAGGGSSWELTLLGEGAVPTREILAALRAAGYNGWLAVEWEKKWHPKLEEPEVALPQHIERLQEYLTS
jgi:fatty-acyl-CoA synthase